jgi:hypothetical protein
MAEERRSCLMLMLINWSCRFQSEMRHGVCVRWPMHGSLFPGRVVQFKYCEPSPDLLAGVAGYSREFLNKCSKAGL